MDSIMPEPTCLTSVIQAMVIHPSSKKVPKKRRRKPWGRRPRKKAIMVSDDENNDEVKPEVEDPPDGMVGRSAFQESCHPEQPVGTPTSPRVLPAAPITASEVSSFAEHLARCAVDWDYPRVLSPRGGYESDPFSQKMTPPQAGETFTPPVSAQPLSPLALEQSPTPTRSTSNRVSRKRRHASSDLSAGSERPQAPQTSAGRSVGPENVEPTTKPARRRKRRRLFR
ncbi:hypothetical protein BYT27DRAFT_6690191 [Phlegmacium glaucopus]|nr:hypothetical protein BYT27DRAFT_6690191 [Phlegmacium glaucopus]